MLHVLAIEDFTLLAQRERHNEMSLEWPEINALMSDVEEFCEIVPVTLDIPKEARRHS
ncbi:hypothetical protein ACTMU2_21150 [Cupriavidus basilensis]